MPNLIYFVCDIDGTLADNSERAKLLQKRCIACTGLMVGTRLQSFCETCQMYTSSKITQSSWDAFMSEENLHTDTPVPGAAEFLEEARSLKYSIVFLTGRHERVRGATELWLKTHMGRQSGEQVIMRDGDDVPASQMKEKIFLRFRATQDPTEARYIFLEDDPHVFDTYRQWGLVLKCPEAFTLGILNPKGDQKPEPVRKV